MNCSILYIEKLGSFSIIHYINGDEKINVSLLQYLNDLCLKELTTLDGRIKAIKQSYKIIKNVPIYISEDKVFFNVEKLTASNNLLINTKFVKAVEPLENKCKIIFYNNLSIIINKEYQVIRNKIEKCLKIKTQINHYC